MRGIDEAMGGRVLAYSVWVSPNAGKRERTGSGRAPITYGESLLTYALRGEFLSFRILHTQRKR